MGSNGKVSEAQTSINQASPNAMYPPATEREKTTMAYLLHQLLQQSAQRTPEKTAVRHKGVDMSYAELDAQSHQLAATLQQAGIMRGDRIGIYLDKSLPAIVTIFGILKAGAVYVLLDPAAPVQRIAFIIQNCQMKAVVSTVAKMASLHKNAADNLVSLQGVILVDESAGALMDTFSHVTTWPDLLATSADPLDDADLIENDLAYILYTSGSTGTPKGVMISHRASLTFVNWVTETFQVRASDRLSNHAPLHFDLSVLDIFGAIQAGATVVLVPLTLSVFPRTLADFINEEEITIWYSVPSILTSLVLHGELDRYTFPHLHTIFFAGEVFPIKYLRSLKELLPQPRYFNLFGPTETNVCSYYEVPELSAERIAPLSIGKACENYELFVLDEDGNVASAGTEGELCARGPGIMTGYWGLPERTAQSRLPFTLHPALGPEIIYRTGDMVRQEADGNYTYLGRRDSQIKSRGFRIELGEIETALDSHPAIEEAAVIPIPDDEIGNQIKAFVVAHTDENLKVAELQTFCAMHIPKYMVPHQIELCDALPKTSTGKIDKRALKARG